MASCNRLRAEEAKAGGREMPTEAKSQTRSASSLEVTEVEENRETTPLIEGGDVWRSLGESCYKVESCPLHPFPLCPFLSPS